MDLLFSKYADPFQFMRLYIDNGRFGEFVTEIVKTEHKKRIEQAKKENENRLFEMYVHSYSEKSYEEWKKDQGINKDDKTVSKNKDDDMSNEDIKNLLDSLFDE